MTTVENVAYATGALSDTFKSSSPGSLLYPFSYMPSTHETTTYRSYSAHDGGLAHDGGPPSYTTTASSIVDGHLSYTSSQMPVRTVTSQDSYAFGYPLPTATEVTRPRDYAPSRQQGTLGYNQQFMTPQQPSYGQTATYALTMPAGVQGTISNVSTRAYTEVFNPTLAPMPQRPPPARPVAVAMQGTPMPATRTGEERLVMGENGYLGASLFVFHVPGTWGEQDLYDHFRPFGTIVRSGLYMEKRTNRHRGFGFVSYSHPRAAFNALKYMNGFRVEGTNKRLHVECRRGEEPFMKHALGLGVDDPLPL